MAERALSRRPGALRPIYVAVSGSATWTRAGWICAAAEELLAEFFISLNKDSDLYPGVQQGDNGQIADAGRRDADGDAGGQRADADGAARVAVMSA